MTELDRPAVRGGAPTGRAFAWCALLLLMLVIGLLWRAERSAMPGDSSASFVAAEYEKIRSIAFEYVVELPASLGGESGGGRVAIFLPIARDYQGQRITRLEIDSPYPGRLDREPVYGNRFWYAELPAERETATRIAVRYRIERSVVRAGDEPGARQEAVRFLGPSERVPVGAPMLEPILAEIRAASPGGDRKARARAIYDWVVDNVEYKKVGTGWGNGDTFWACTARYGNCTDFHSLFLSLARTEQIPARFEMGFPIPEDRDAGRIAGYHCWVEFWLPETGWVPIDASEAFKRPEARELFYGTHPADRVHFTRGRDLRLGAEHRDRPLNYFIYPYLERDGKRLEASVETEFRYRELGTGQGVSEAQANAAIR